ncbi:hypothetical protein EJ994_14665 [Maribacter sp. MJ134]|uniref:hypothetical protein n=1 Tax=Maribacter sp. MJ134 TaxID=2496865 RepID=UPI000F8298F5|nr:hypothetical protein [Maribacter sp. MJ134]AZQ59979.1 hypothetical protein EJ994_14665 [Maribacter sp. MJ134]
MGGGGFATHAMKTVKANRTLLHKRRSFKEIRESYAGYTGDTQLHFKELTPFQQKVIRDKIIAAAKKERLHELGRYALALVGAIGILWLLVQFWTS